MNPIPNFSIFTLCFLLLCNASAQVLSPRAASQQPAAVHKFSLNLPALVVTGQPTGESVHLAWDNPISGDFDGVSVYASSNRFGPWRKIGTVLVPSPPTLTASNIFLPQWFVARSFTSEPSPIVLQPDIVNESEDSNRLGILGWQEVLSVTNVNLTSTNLSTWSELARQLVFVATNVAGLPDPQRHFRSRQDIAIRRERIVE